MRKNFKKLGFALAAAGAIGAPVAALVSCSFDKPRPREGEWVTYNRLSTSWDSRTFDLTFVNGNTFNALTGAAQTFSFFRTYSEGVDHKRIITENGQKKVIWDDAHKRIMHKELVKGFQFSVDGINWYSNIENNKDAQKALSGKLSEIRFRIDPKREVYYATAKNGEVVKTKTKLEMRDFFYGWVRQLYSMRTVAGVHESSKKKGEWVFEHKSTLLGKDTGLEPFKKSDWAALSDKEHDISNSSAYLFGLYDINVKATVNANKNTSKDEFIIKYNSTRTATDYEQTLLPFVDTSTFSPVPSRLIDKLPNGKVDPKSPVAKYGIVKWGRTKHKGNVADTEYQNYSIAPYLYTSYDHNVGGKTTLSLNKFYADQDLVSDPRRIQHYSTIQKSNTIDANTYVSSRLNGFYNAKITGEYSLDPQVSSSPNTIQEINNQPKYYRYNKANQTMIMNTFFTVSPFAANFGLYNDKARKLIWGYSKIEDIKRDENSDALDNFYDGYGADLRAAIHSAINWYTVVQNFFNIRSLTFYGGVAQEGSYQTSGFNTEDHSKIYGKPSYIDSLEKMKDMFKNNNGAGDKQYESSKLDQARSTLNELADKVGATKSDPIQIPLLKYIWKGLKVTDEFKKTSEKILQLLNSLTGGRIKFVYQKEISWGEYVKQAINDKTYFLKYTSFSPDYPGLGSIYQQFIGPFGNLSEIQIIRKVLGISKTKNLTNNQRAHVNFADLGKYLANKQKQGLYKNITADRVKKLGIGDIEKIIKDYGPSKLDKEDRETFADIDALIIAYMFNRNTNTDVMGEFDSYVLDNAFTAFTPGSRGGRGPIRQDAIEGQRVYQRIDLGFMTQRYSNDSIDLLHSVYKGFKD